MHLCVLVFNQKYYEWKKMKLYRYCIMICMKSLIIAMHRKYTYEYHSPHLRNQDHMCIRKTRLYLYRSRVYMDCHCTSPHLQLIWYCINHLDYFLFGYMCIHLKAPSKTNMNKQGLQYYHETLMYVYIFL